MKKKKVNNKEKVSYVSEVDETVLTKDIAKTQKIMKEIKKDYMKMFEKVSKLSLQGRIFATELILQAVLTDAKIPYPNAIHIIGKLKFNLLRNENQTIENSIASQFKSDENPERSYIG